MTPTIINFLLIIDFLLATTIISLLATTIILQLAKKEKEKL